MVKNADKLRQFEDEFTRTHTNTFQKRLEIFEDMSQHAYNLGAIPPQNPLVGIEHKIELVRILRSIDKTNKKNRN